ncbi:MAG: hypothetical protein IPG96_05725 [Proteobacteria bacterium]|nr:hypothetical protein [Pseudomonadota bacterium]
MSIGNPLMKDSGADFSNDRAEPRGAAGSLQDAAGSSDHQELRIQAGNAAWAVARVGACSGVG